MLEVRKAEFYAARAALQLPSKGHYAQLERRLESDEPMPSLMSWYREVEPDNYGITLEGTVLDPLLRQRLAQTDEPVAETARWFYDLYLNSDGVSYEHFSRLEWAAYEVGVDGPDHADKAIAKLEAIRAELRRARLLPDVNSGVSGAQAT
jgi:hypothetical protein